MNKEIEYYSEICEQCGAKMDLGFRYTDWHYEQNDTYGTFEECKKIFDEAVKNDKELRCSIYDISSCKCGNERDEGIIFNENCSEYEVN
jgi:predicted oxidoreductase